MVTNIIRQNTYRISFKHTILYGMNRMAHAYNTKDRKCSIAISPFSCPPVPVALPFYLRCIPIPIANVPKQIEKVDAVETRKYRMTVYYFIYLFSSVFPTLPFLHGFFSISVCSDSMQPQLWISSVCHISADLYLWCTEVYMRVVCLHVHSICHFPVSASAPKCPRWHIQTVGMHDTDSCIFAPSFSIPA